nr:MBOAT family protein [Eubacterium sp.]
LVIDLGLLGYFKYADLIIRSVNQVAGTDLGLLNLALPIGISFYTFQTLSYTIDVYRGRTRAQHSLVDFSMYVCFFPQLIAGPIVRYVDIENQLRTRKETWQQVEEGVLRFSMGLGKKVLLANQIGALWTEISSQMQGALEGGSLASPNQPALTAWLGVLAFSFQIYFDFSGYSDMAIGLGKIFGFTFPENFNEPYLADSITDFWRRWHMSLSSWFRDYVYIPLGGNKKGMKRQIFNLLIVWGLTGLWHGADWNFLLWGLYYFVLLVVEKVLLLPWLEKAPRALRHLYTMFLVVLGWMIFALTDLGQIATYTGNLFGAGGLADAMSLYYLKTNLILLVALCFVAFGGGKRLLAGISTWGTRGKGPEKICNVLKVLATLAILVSSISLLVGDSYNPFLYFRF